VADIARVGRPVGAEFELHHDAGGYADREGQREDPRPEPRHLMVKRIALPQPESFDQDQDDAQANAERRKDIVERDRESEL
jgi:hypothetical protein